MRTSVKLGTIVVLAVFLAGNSPHSPAQSSTAQSTTIAALKRAFEHPPGDARIMMRWWWFGPSAAKPELEREMRLMKEAGIGGFEVQPVYPLTLDGNYKYLSPEFLDALHFTGQKARELGLRMDLTLGSGWPYGGPHIPVSKAAGRLRVERVPAPKDAASVPVPRMADGEALVARGISPGKGRAVATHGFLPTTGKRSRNESKSWALSRWRDLEPISYTRFLRYKARLRRIGSEFPAKRADCGP